MDYLLFIDDDKNILDINRVYFERNGFQVSTASSYDAALNNLRTTIPDCVILDILMPGMDGLTACRKIKKQYNVPILFLTSISEKEYLYRGFSLGCDDFLTKPYDFLELKMRITALIRRVKNGQSKACATLVFPPLSIDERKHLVTIDEKEVPLTAYEFDILLLLASHPDEVFSMKEIYHQVWKLPDIENAQTVQVHLARMRHKLEHICPDHSFIRTVWKQGYKFYHEQKK